MSKILFVTGNSVKFGVGQIICQKADLELEQGQAEIDEIQGESPEPIIKAKAQAAFELFKRPLIVSDDSWNIPALNGFPGAYMKAINHWFTPDDFLRLMHGVSERTVILHQYIAYIDEHETVIFNADLQGKISEEARGTYSDKDPWMEVVSMDVDNGRTLAEVWGSGDHQNPERYENTPEAWTGFASWYKEKHT